MSARAVLCRYAAWCYTTLIGNRSRTKKFLVLEDVEEGEWNNTNVDQYYCDKLTLEVWQGKTEREERGLAIGVY